MFHKKIFAAVAVLLAATIVVTQAASDQTADSALTEKYTDAMSYSFYQSNRYTHVPDMTKTEGVLMDTDGFALVAENEQLALLIREETSALRIVDKASGYVWGSLTEDQPENLNKMWSAFGNSIVSIEYFDETATLKRIGAGDKDASRRYHFGENFVVCDVSFDKLGISLSAKAALNNDHITFSLDDTSIREEKNFSIAEVYFAPFLGATEGDKVLGYMFIPDGSGALVRFGKPAAYLSGFSRRCYGLDYAIDNLYSVNNLRSSRPNDFSKDEETVSLPVYGIVHGERQNALFGIAGQGAEYSVISATPSGVYTDYNWASISFIYRQVYQQKVSRSGSGVQVVQKSRNTVNPQVSLYLLTGDNADYTGMARLYSDLLTKENKLPESGRKDAPSLALDFIMADIQKGFLFSSTKTVTSLDCLMTVAENLKSDGITNVRLSLQGWQQGGLNGSGKNEVYKETNFGGFQKLSELKTLLQKTNSSLSMYLNPFTAKKPQINERRDVGISLSQAPISTERDDTTVYLGETFYLKYPLALSLLQKQSEIFSKESIGPPVIDGGSYLYGEYLQSGFTSRSKSLSEIEGVFSGLSADEKLTVFKPNDYLFTHTSEYRHAPMNSSQYLYETDSVPFLQIVLSGKIALYAPYANESFYSRESVLKSIEYNCWPSFLLTEKSNHELKKTAIAELSSTCYADWRDTIRSTYEQISKVLSQVRGQQMTKHTVVSEGVVITEYENGGRICVNYLSEPFIFEGENVPAMTAVFIGGDR